MNQVSSIQVAKFQASAKKLGAALSDVDRFVASLESACKGPVVSVVVNVSEDTILSMREMLEASKAMLLTLGSVRASDERDEQPQVQAPEGVKEDSWI